MEMVEGMAPSITGRLLSGKIAEVLNTVKSNYKYLKDSSN
jgi:hypothetical protein